MDCRKMIIQEKEGMVLSMDGTGGDTHFQLEFSVGNPHYDLRKVIDMKIYELMHIVNTDVIEEMVYIHKPTSNTEPFSVCLTFKRFGAELGISQKYLCSKTIVAKFSDDGLCYRSEQCEKPNYVDVGDAEPMLASKGDLEVDFETPHLAKVNYKFSMTLDEDMPPYMLKLPGLLMSKIFLRVKTFIERMT
jgi:hypothetical protein